MVDYEVVKNTKFTLKTKVNNLENKIPDGTTLVHINQYNGDKQNLEKKYEDVDKKISVTSSFVTTTVWIQKLMNFRTKYEILVF